ncbi:NAD-dependent epimerase/dehydratase family protein [Catenovulum maritimum]|uniref:NAD-dependent epimerase/dehydratase domain-containing protein n=1 Tax=Catenovulum maritimum TaxID=1513271 RepID=A0A0J8GZD0_9ALTE|nr:NAD(P)-dependent oxidoreductase [Catenovulum maritimum]KMT66589.1 hypothetical protein XM47_03395 [Catenovulum maritimum]
MFDGKKVLVAGGAGFLGTNLIKRLLDTSAYVRATLHQSKPQIESQKIEWLHTDLTVQSDCAKACEGMDILIICAAYTAGALVIEKQPLALLTPNLVLNAHLLEAAHAAGVKKVIFVSSNTVYPVSDLPMKETDHTGEYFHKYHTVASMKYFSEEICRMYAEKIANPMQVVVIRPGNMYGPYDDFDWETSHVLPAFIRRVVEKHNPMSVWGDGKDIKDLIYVDDVVDGIFAALDSEKMFDIYNIASGQGYCLRDLLATLLQLEGLEDTQVSYDESKPTMIPKRLINVDKAKEKLNFDAKTPITKGLKETIEWYKSQL